MKRIRYIAYGSNMNVEQMKYRCPDAKVLGTSEIENYELVFKCGSRRAVATIEPCAGSSVPVVVWEISESDEKSLDIYEGFPSFYVKSRFRVSLDEPFKAMAYVMSPEYDEYGAPSKSYYETILSGYKHFSLDEEVLKKAVQTSIWRTSEKRDVRRKNAAQIVADAKKAQDKNLLMICPRCGKLIEADLARAALSRRAEIYICWRCGIEEAICDYVGEADPITDWYIVNKFSKKL